MKPIAFGIDTSCRNTANLPKPGGYRVDYKCPECNEVICRFLGYKEKFCHNCGTELNWSVITYINSTQSEKVKESKVYTKALINNINKHNETDNYKGPVFVEEI